MSLCTKRVRIDGAYATLYQASSDNRINRELTAETMDGSDIKATFENNPTNKSLIYSDILEFRDKKGRYIGTKNFFNCSGRERKIYWDTLKYKMQRSVELEERGNVLSPWSVDYYETSSTTINPSRELIRGLPKKISDLPKQVQKVYVDFLKNVQNY